MAQHCLITGASSGLGAALARHYSASTATLTLFGRSADRLEQVADDCRQAGSRVRTVVCEVTDRDAMAHHIATSDCELPIDLVIANAGIGGQQVLTDKHGEPPTIARDILEINLFGVLNTVMPLIDRFVRRRDGHFALVSSMAALQGVGDAPVYSASKAAIRAYGQGLRRMLAAENVSVTVVCPGFIETPMSASLPFKKPFTRSAEQAARRIAKGIERRKAEILFPWQLHALALAAPLLPTRLVDRLLTVRRSNQTEET